MAKQPLRQRNKTPNPQTENHKQNTTMKSAEKKQHLTAVRNRHLAALQSLATNGKTGMQIWRVLRKLEHEAYGMSAAHCSGPDDSNSRPAPGYSFPVQTHDWCRYVDDLKPRIAAVFGTMPKGVFVNGDARGGALKMEREFCPAGMWGDFVGNGMLAVEITADML